MSNNRFWLSNRHRSYDVITGCLYLKDGQQSAVDLYERIVPTPRAFAWNYLALPAARYWMWDFDGVFCVDPDELEDESLDWQHRYIENALPLFLPKLPVGRIVTNRLERNRRGTQEWMKRHGVESLGGMVMRTEVTAAERQKSGRHAEFKAKQFAGSGFFVFVESSPMQARRIAEIAKKPVLCVEDETVYRG